MRSVGACEYVAVGYDRHAHGVYHVAYRVPVGASGVHLYARAAVDGYGGRPRLLENLCDLHVVHAARVPTLAYLHRHRHIHRGGDRGGYLSGQLGGLHQRRAVPALDYLAHRAAHVDVDYIRAADLQRTASALGHALRLVPEYLRGHRAAVLRYVQQRSGFPVVVAQRLCADHLRVHQRRALLQAERPEGRVAHAGHRRQHRASCEVHGAYVKAAHFKSSPTGQWSLPIISGRINASAMRSRSRSEQRK